MPSVVYNTHERTHDLFDHLHEIDKKDWVAVGACMRSVYGLYRGHAYTILGAHVVHDHDGKQWKLIRMRNPHGKSRYNGPWSDRDRHRMTDRIKKAIGHTHEDDGIFLIPVEYWRRAFTRYYVAMYQDWKTTTHINTLSKRIHHFYFSSSVD